MSPGSSLSGLLEFGVSTPSDRVLTRSVVPTTTEGGASFKKSLDQAAHHQRQQSDNRATREGGDSGTDSGTAGAAPSPHALDHQPPEAYPNNDPAGSAGPESAGAARGSAAGEPPSSDSTADLEWVGVLPGLIEPDRLDADDSTATESDINPDMIVVLPWVPMSELADARLTPEERQARAAALSIADQVPVFAAQAQGARLPRSIHELRFSEFVQNSSEAGVNPAMESLTPALSATAESGLLLNENLLTVQSETEWVIDESALSLSTTQKPATSSSILNPATAETQRISVPVNVVFGHERWQHLAAERTVTLLQQGIKSAELMLDPPELGPLQVRIQMQNDQAVIHFTSASAAVRDALDQTIPRLREMLQEQGVDLLQAGVSDQSSQDGSEAESQRDSERSAFSRDDPDTTASPLPDPAPQQHTLILNAGIDDFA